MKYEMIFGDEKLFYGAPEDAEYAGWFCQVIRWYMILNGKIMYHLIRALCIPISSFF